MAKLQLDNITKMYGNELYVHGRYGGRLLSARLPEGTQMKIGNSFILKIDPKKLYIFDAETKENLS